MDSDRQRRRDHGESMSPSALDADFAQLQASQRDGMIEGERSQMYETGE